ncbi:hypothetical protein [Phnomibacter sp. MR]|uniref:hypothetical protein n=1 Tax=Phnomibacter sp. MR TaxID=3042318 RepID=UPI003A80BEBB
MNQIRTDCTDFELRKNEFENGLCETDGHYLCRNCKHLAPYELMSEWDNKRAYYPKKAKEEMDAQKLKELELEAD